MENSKHGGGKKDIRQAYREAYLVAAFLKNKLTQEEKKELDEWILASEENMIQFEWMTDPKNLAKAKTWFKNMNVEKAFEETKDRIANQKTKRIWRYTVAASIVVIIGLGGYMYISSGSGTKNPPLTIEKNDILPGGDKASLTLENGKVILLDNIGTDSSVNDQIKILKNQGEVIYDNTPTSNEMSFNTLTIPRKGHYKLTLPDGTIVWLNSESSIRFPIAFADSERKVFVTGETFFEVAKDKTKPFRVVAGDITIEALGTKFNVNHYPNEQFASATLVEGSVLVTNRTQENILKPGQQAQMKVNGEWSVVSGVNLEEVIAWKNDQFKFRNTPIESIMRQIERWYDADVVYQDKISLHFNATIPRNVPVSKLLQILEETDEIHFKIEGRTIYVRR